MDTTMPLGTVAEDVAARRTAERIARRRLEPPSKPAKAAFRTDWLPLLLVLLAQAVLAYRLTDDNTAFVDEGTYIYAGYNQIEHLLHGEPVADYASFFSGSPLIYPVFVAMADMAGGLLATRLLSMAFMLTATVALHLATRRMYGSVAAFFATALFVALGPTQLLSSYSTYDSMALTLLAWGAYFAVRLTTGGGYSSMIMAAMFMALADWTKYASLLWTPVVIGIAIFAGHGGAAWSAVRIRRGIELTVLWLVALLLPAVTAKTHVDGFTHTTLMRKPGTDPVSYVAGEAAKWVGPLLVLALIGVLVTLVLSKRGRASKADVWLALLLFVGGVLAPANQIRIHTWLSLQKHVDFGAWFACIAAGVLLARIFVTLRGKVHVTAGVLVTALVVAPLTYFGAGQSAHMYAEWSDSSGLVSALRPYVKKGKEEYLVENYNVPAYYLKEQTTWPQWQDLVGKSYTDPETKKTLSGAPALQAAVKDHYYSIVVLDFTQTPDIDVALQPSLKEAGYRVHKVIKSTRTGDGQYTIYFAPGFGKK
ncbi:ArnT family glycosyltransferase [Streptomyces sp. NPDC001536]|uniref:ArnT family glycosyltransferase n=1 Tax=Streptomyces sp. NPDC001536 TaxID=3364583 RepID=UPI0036C2EC27